MIQNSNINIFIKLLAIKDFHLILNQIYQLKFLR